MPAVKRIPQRTCLACRQVRAKRELLRLVCVEGGAIEVDNTGRKPGRGAYFCRSLECWQNGLKDSRIEQALRNRLSADDRERLLKQARELLKSQKPGDRGAFEGAGQS